MIERGEHAARLIGVALAPLHQNSETRFEARFHCHVNPFLSLCFDLDSPHGRRESNGRAVAGRMPCGQVAAGLKSSVARAALAVVS